MTYPTVGALLDVSRLGARDGAPGGAPSGAELEVGSPASTKYS